MPDDHGSPPAGRRHFLRQGAAVGGLLPGLPSALAAGLAAAPATTPPPTAAMTAPAPGYLSLGPDEAAFVETLVDTMCPEDALTPSGTRCGLAVYIDRQLAGDFGRGARRYDAGPWLEGGKPQHGLQLPMTPEQHFKAGIEAVNAACLAQHGKRFDQLDAPLADQLLARVSDGHLAADRLSLATWFNELVYPLFNEACFADPIYGGNIDKVFWKLIGYPGLPATHAIDVVKYRGVRYPGAADPRGIADFS